MKQKLIIRNTIDEEGKPCGGSVRGIGIDITWQDGPLAPASSLLPYPLPAHPAGIEAERPGHNGAFVEGVIMAAYSRLEHYQRSKFACEENAKAMEHLGFALQQLEARTIRRVAAGTEGTHKGN